MGDQQKGQSYQKTQTPPPGIDKGVSKDARKPDLNDKKMDDKKMQDKGGSCGTSQKSE